MILLKFYATWCGPCKLFGPVLDEFAKQHDLHVEEIDIDEQPDVAERFGIQSVPTTLLVKGGAELKRIVGAKPSAFLADELSEYL